MSIPHNQLFVSRVVLIDWVFVFENLVRGKSKAASYTGMKPHE